MGHIGRCTEIGYLSVLMTTGGLPSQESLIQNYGSNDSLFSQMLFHSLCIVKRQTPPHQHQEEEKTQHSPMCAQPTNNARQEQRPAPPPLPKQGDQNAKRTDRRNTHKEQGKTKREVPRSVNYRATQNKNNTGTTALEW